MKLYIKGIGFTLALFSSAANAIPTLFFDGTINFDKASNMLSVDSVLTATDDLSSSVNIINSSLQFNALFDNIDTTNALFTLGNFTGVNGNDLVAVDGDNNTILTGDFTDLNIKGANGFNSGKVTGTLDATGGSLANEFGTGSNLIALQFNLSTSFSATMFDYDFNGDIDGRVEGGAPTPVPAPGILALLAPGILLISLSRRRNNI